MLMAIDIKGHFEPITQAQAQAIGSPKAIAACWYILRLHPNYDLKAERQLHAANVVAYVPKEMKTVRTQWNRKALRTRPIFPGTLFVPDFEADVARLKNLASGIGGFIKSDGRALQVSLSWMDRIRRFEARVQGLSGQRKYRLGDKVRIKGGPFDLWEGRIERLDSQYRVRVLLAMLQREVPVEFDEDQVEAV